MINSKDFREFFFYGIDNMEELKEGILYFASQELYAKKYRAYNIYEIPNKILIDDMLKIANKRYRHAIRFINFNDRDNDFEYDVDIRESYLELEKKIKELLEENKVIESKAGVFFTREEERKLKLGKYYVYGEGEKGEDGWTKKVYDILSELDEIEKRDNDQYYKYWIQTKLKRTENRVEKLDKETAQQENAKEEVKKVRRAYEAFRDKKIKTKKVNKEIDILKGE